MKKYYFLLVFFGALLFCACEKEITQAPDLQQEDTSTLKKAKADKTYGWEKPKELWVNVDGVNISYTKNGKGKEVIVFVHGLTGEKMHWYDFNQYFCSKARIVMVDLPGHGMSDAPEDLNYTMDFHAKVLNAVMLDAGAQHATLVTHSMGLAVARQLIQNYPIKVKQLINLEGVAFHYPADGQERIDYLDFIEGLRDIFINLLPADLIQWIDDYVIGDDSPDWLAPMLHDGIVDFASVKPHVLRSCYLNLTEEALWEYTPEWDTPVLSVYANEPDLEVEEGLFNGSEVVVLEGDPGHIIQLERPAEVIGLIEEFVFE